ncbi:aspartate-semialdehyde dehydrogenase [Alcanivorax sp. JB21]|uniref:aspartate-semialdehyde dehydrogenase n=1 Tax=Alcanivorax limicola TaxID=2874102 RepID=UPI001CBD3F03|nr:aspartate-semialdehyde dehydrogenase [Alcanivorax limicola]MBZ2187670.1 aspartate-semialdehyde dehydrogenase [Alcanivorax limicola]
MSRQFDIAIAGATGLVGEMLVELLAASDLPVGEVALLASAESAGKRLAFRGRHRSTQALDEFDFSTVQLAFFAVPEAVAQAHVERAAEAGAIVIDVSGAFAADQSVPVVVPEVNAEMLTDFRERGIIASPSPGSIQLAMALKPFLDAVGLGQINVTVCESVSEAGRPGVDELASQTARLLNGQSPEPKLFNQQIAFNALPQTGAVLESGASRSEVRLALETMRLLGEPGLRINATCLRLPVFFGTSLVVQLETGQPLDAGQAVALLESAPGLVVVERPEGATLIGDALGHDGVWVSRVRADLSREQGLNLCLVTDNLRKGAALNCVQIAELLIKDHL